MAMSVGAPPPTTYDHCHVAWSQVLLRSSRAGFLSGAADIGSGLQRSYFNAGLSRLKGADF
jgi:hypothetical protein